jgi:hypothetical protein
VKPGRTKLIICAALSCLGAAILTGGAVMGRARAAAPHSDQNVISQEPPATKRNARPDGEDNAPPADQNTPANATHFTYEFRQPQFYRRHVIIKHDANGHGQITIERLNEEDPIVEPLTISPIALSRILGLWTTLHFLDSNEDYQSIKQFPHLGTHRLEMEEGDRKRSTELNWSNNKDAWALVTEYQRLTEQTSFVLDLSLARENQPLNAPKLLDGLEASLKRNALSDPQQLLPLLNDISVDERLPLIARNHAARIVKMIQTK